MTPDLCPCPTCKGRCCRIDGFPVSHGNEWRITPRSHVCPDCDDGTYEVCGDPEPFIRERTYEDGIAEGERRATASVVAWLRGYDANVYPSWLPEADAIERGEHRREEEK